MDDPVPVPDPPSRWRWKLWHLAALVAGSSVLFALQHYSPWTFCAFGISFMMFSPAILAVLVGNRLFLGLLRLFRFPEESFRALALRAVLLLAFVVAWRPWFSLTFAVFKRLCPE
jgi:hypothetical protein